MKRNIRLVLHIGLFAWTMHFAAASSFCSPSSDGKADGVQEIQVKSSVISKIAYNPAGGILEVSFYRGPSRCYYDVPPEVFRDFLAAESKGRFFNSHIRRKYKSAASVQAVAP
jgi:hypothetical protein